MKMLNAARNVVCAVVLIMLGSNAFATCTSGTGSCATYTGKIVNLYYDAGAVYKTGAVTTTPYWLVTIDTSVSGGGAAGTSPANCLVSGTTYKVNMQYAASTNTIQASGQAVYTAMLTAKTAGNMVVLSADPASNACNVVAAQIQP